MPRERITQAGIDPGPGEPGFSVEVAWHPNVREYVELVTTAPDADQRLRRWQEVPDKGGDVTPPGTSFHLFDGWHVFLDRQEINTLIRVLRRARNSAFGADE
jgi:hypothetical protein